MSEVLRPLLGLAPVACFLGALVALDSYKLVSLKAVLSVLAAGVARGDRDDPYANFFFGGFGNNYVDANRPEKRYREYDSFPGFEINELRARRFSRHMLEANLPPYIFESVGTPAFHLAWLRPAVFGSALFTERSPGQKGRYANAGAQVDLRFSVLHWYEMTLSAGYAVGYRGGERAGHEWMVSLKIM